MAQRNGLITLQSFLHKYFAKVMIDEDEMDRYHIIGCEGLKELSIHHLPMVTNAVLTIDTTNYTADYPDDYINYLAVAVEQNGKWWTFTRSHKMVDKTVAGVDGEDLSDTNYTVGPGSVGGENTFYFNDDPKNRRFLFDESYSSDTIILRYVSSGVESTSYGSTTDVQFPIQAESSMEKYIRWMVCEYDDGGAGECERRKRQYNEAVLMMRNLDLPTVDEIRDIWLGSSNQTFIRLP